MRCSMVSEDAATLLMFPAANNLLQQEEEKEEDHNTDSNRDDFISISRFVWFLSMELCCELWRETSCGEIFRSLSVSNLKRRGSHFSSFVVHRTKYE